MKRLCLILICLLAITALLWFVISGHEPRHYYQGKSARYWVLKPLPLYASTIGLDQKSAEALREIGSNAVPEILTILNTTNLSSYDRAFLSILPRLPANLRKKAVELYPVPPIFQRHYKAMRALEILGPDARSAIQPLIGRLNSTDLMLQMTAVQALAAIGEDAMPPLIEIMRRKDKTSFDHVRIILIFQMAGPKAHAAVPVLLNEMYNQNSSVPAARALGLIGSMAMPTFLEKATNSDALEREQAAWGLAFAAPKDERVLPALVRASEDPVPAVRKRGIESLGVLAPNNSDCIPPLIARLSDPDPQVRLEAIQVLGHAGNVALPAAPRLIDLLSETSPLVREQACLALGRIGPPAKAGIELITPLTHDPDESVRQAATVALMAIKRAP